MFYLKIFIGFLEKIILPYRCVMCFEASDQHRDICRHCQQELPTPSHACSQCGNLLPLLRTVPRCGQCIKHPPAFDQTIIGFKYQPPIDIWLKQFKFHKKGLYARILTEIYIDKLSFFLQQHPDDKPQVLIPVPLHWRRVVWRGFNQAYIIARYLSKKLHIPIVSHRCVTRTKYTQPQANLNQHKRRSNIKGAFYVKNLLDIHHAVIVDDIFTTGNTVDELARQLKKQGVQRVSIWALARANFS